MICFVVCCKAATFDIVGDHYTYVIWYNVSLTMNSPQYVDDQYGLGLPSLMRGIDEAIGKDWFL